jgi:hypothetical protein
MKTTTLYLATITAFVWISFGQSSAATIPAGATLVVQTLDPISSVDAPGRRFRAQLATDVTVNGKVVLPSGTKVSGKVETSRRTTMASQQLTVNITDVELAGRTVSVKTAGAHQLSNGLKTRRGVSVSRHSYVVAAGRKIDFKLAAPLNL